MKTRHTLLLLALAFGVFLSLHFLGKGRPGSREARDRDRFATRFDRDDVIGLRIASGDGKIVIRKEGDRWLLTEPLQDVADPQLVGQILTDLEMVRAERAIDLGRPDDDKTREALKEYGLASPKMRVEFEVKPGAETPPALLIGKDTAVEDRIYFRTEDSTRVYVVPAAVRDLVNRPANDFRDPYLSDLEESKIDRVSLRLKAGEIELRRQTGGWNLMRPIRARADGDKASVLAGKLATARIEQFVADDKADLETYGLAQPTATIQLQAGDGAPAEAKLGREEPGKGVYALLPARHAVVLLQADIAAVPRISPNDLRDRHLARLNHDLVDRITIQLTGAGPVVLHRVPGGWRIGGPDGPGANPAMVDELLRTLTAAPVKEFVADTLSDLPKYGLDQPQLRVRVSSYASENVPESGAGEHPLASLAFGRSVEGKTYARAEEEPFVVAVEDGLLSTIAVDPAKWRDLRIFDEQAGQFLSLQREGFSPAHLEADGRGGWRVAGGGDGSAEAINARSMANTLSRLRVVRWEGAAREEHGLAAPRLTLRWRTPAGERRLLVGAERDGMVFAARDPAEGVFVISRPDYEALVLPLVK